MDRTEQDKDKLNAGRVSLDDILGWVHDASMGSHRVAYMVRGWGRTYHVTLGEHHVTDCWGNWGKAIK